MHTEAIRVFVYQFFARTGQPPSAIAIANEFGISEEDAQAHLAELANSRHLVLGAAGEILMAHPFSSIPLGFAVMGSQTLWWGGCAWDSFALPHVLEDQPEVLVSTNCPNCQAALAWNVSIHEPPKGDQLAHFLVPTSKMWDDVVHTCGNQRIFCNQVCIDQWLVDNQLPHGYVMSLETLWNLASGWYAGRLSEGYVRREPAEAKDYFRKAGLSGEFWGL